MKKISIKNIDGTIEEVDLINSFKIDKVNKQFVILSKNESAGEGMSKIYISEIVEAMPGVYNAMGIQDDETWQLVKQAMKQIVEGTQSADLVLSQTGDVTSLNIVVDPNIIKRVAVSNERTTGLGRVIAAPAQVNAAPVSAAPVVPTLEPQAVPISNGVSKGVVDAVNNFYNESGKDTSTLAAPGAVPAYDPSQVGTSATDGLTSPATLGVPGAVPALNPTQTGTSATDGLVNPALNATAFDAVGAVPAKDAVPSEQTNLDQSIPGGSLGVEQTNNSSFVSEYKPSDYLKEKEAELNASASNLNDLVPPIEKESVDLNNPIIKSVEKETSEPEVVEKKLDIDMASIDNNVKPPLEMISTSEDDDDMNLRAILESGKRAAEEQVIRFEMAIEALDRKNEAKKNMSR